MRAPACGRDRQCGASPAKARVRSPSGAVIVVARSEVVPRLVSRSAPRIPQDPSRASTWPKRTPAAPDIPTVAESGVAGYEVTTFYGMSAPAKTPRSIIERIHADTVRALNAPEVRRRLQELGADPVGNTPEQYTAFMQNEIAKWGKVIRAAGIKGE